MMRSYSLVFVVVVGMLGCTSRSNSVMPGTDASAGSSGSSSGGTAGGRGGGSGGGSGDGSGGMTGSEGGTGGAVEPMADAGTDTADGGDASPTVDAVALPRFSFFVTSIEALRTLSGNMKGFGGDLRFGKADGLSGADEICRRTAEMGMPGAGQKTWRAFLSVTAGPEGTPVNAIDRVGSGPWYDRVGRIVAMNKADLSQPRPRGAAPQIINDLPNEHGIPNGFPMPGGPRVDNHHMLTGSRAGGLLNSMNKADTCQDWTSAVGSGGRPQCGIAWPRTPGASWIAWGTEGGCAPGFNLIDSAPATEGNMAVGSNGGYGGFYCLALQP